MYIVIEIQTNADGTVGTIITQWNELNAAESKYHGILAAAAVSTLPVHAAAIITNEGRMVRFESYGHQTEEEEK